MCLCFQEISRSSFSVMEDDCDDCCASCCCVGCSVLGYAICFKKMRRSIRIRLFMIYLNILCLTFGIITGAIFFGPYTTHFTSTDFRSIKDRLSFLFCEGVTITSVGDLRSSFSAYILDSEPMINETFLQSFTSEVTMYVHQEDYKYHSFYLLRGSVINVGVCADSFIQMNIIKGKHDLKEYIDNNFACDSCIKKTINVYQRKCLRTSDFVEVLYNVSESDDYFIFYLSPLEDVWVTAKYHINRTIYDVSTARDAYSSVVQCEFSLDLKPQYIIVHLDNTGSMAQYNIMTDCKGRTWVYLSIFFVIPYLIGIFVCILIYKCCKDPDTSELTGEISPSINSPLIYNYPSYQSTEIIGPPKYEDIIRDEAPPPYSEAIGPIIN